MDFVLTMPSALLGGLAAGLGLLQILKARTRRFRYIGVVLLLAGAALLAIAAIVAFREEATRGAEVGAAAAALVGAASAVPLYRARYRLRNRGRRLLGAPPPRQAATAETEAPHTRVKVGRPAVTVVVTATNEEQLLVDAVESIHAQSLREWAAIIVVGGTDGDTFSIASELQDTFTAVKTVRVAGNDSPAVLRNIGLAMARTPYIMFVDADDALAPDALEGRYQVMLSVGNDPGVAGVAGKSRQVPFNFVVQEDHQTRSVKGLDRQSELVDAIEGAALQSFSPTLGVLWKTPVVRGMGGFDETAPAEDLELLERIFVAGYGIQAIDRIDAFYRQRPSSRHKSDVDPVAAALGGYTMEFTGSGSRFTSIRASVHLAKRLIPFAAYIAATTGRIPTDILEKLEQVSEPWLSRHVDVAALAKSGFNRAHLGTNIATTPNLLPQFIGDCRSHLAATASDPSPREAKAVLIAFADRDLAYLTSELSPEDQARSVAASLGGVAPGVLAPAGSESIVRHSIAEDAAVYVTTAPAHPAICSFICDVDTSTPVFAVKTPWSDEVVAEDAPVCHHATVVDSVGAALSKDRGDHGDPTSGGGPRLKDVSLRRLAPKTGASDTIDLLHYAVYPPVVDAERWMAKFRNRHEGETCIIIGNGPSLNAVDVDDLASVPTFGVNGIFYLTDSTGFVPTYYVVEDTAFFADNAERIAAYRASTKLFPGMYRERLDALGSFGSNNFFNLDGGFYHHNTAFSGWPRFSRDAGSIVYAGQSVTYVNLQLAFHMGFSKVVLVGMDFSYTRPPSTIVDGHLWTSTEDDPNHFNPEYFGAGKTWKDPRLDRVLSNYRYAHRVFEQSGREIINATAGGKLEEFRREDLKSAIGKA